MLPPLVRSVDQCGGIIAQRRGIGQICSIRPAGRPHPQEAAAPTRASRASICSTLASRFSAIRIEAASTSRPSIDVCAPDGVDGKAIQGRLLREHAIEVGGGLGPGTPPIWRIGLMGHNATRATADRVLAAFDDVLASERSARDAVAAPA